MTSPSESGTPPLRKHVKELFATIRNRRDANRGARDLLTRMPHLANAVAKAPPKQDDGQSPLQVALKTANYEIAELLLDLGADVNFQERPGTSTWTAPVLHDAIRAAVLIWAYSDGTDARTERALRVFQRVLALGADPNATDSYGNSPLDRAMLDARQMLSGEPGFPEAIADSAKRKGIEQVFMALRRAGADYEKAPRKEDGTRHWESEPVMMALLRVAR